MQEQENNLQEREQGETLDGAAAYVLANRLIIIPRFPRDPVAVEQVADWLLELCMGAELEGEPWTPRDQAGWVIEQAIREFSNWDQSQGLPAMRAIYNRKFNPPPAQVEFQGFGEKPVISCTICGDNGTVERDGIIRWCVCPQANQLAAQAPQLVEILNRPFPRTRASEFRKADVTVQQLLSLPETSPAEQQNKAAIRAEIARIERQREGDAKHANLSTGPLSFLRRPWLCRVLGHWAGRILRTRVP